MNSAHLLSIRNVSGPTRRHPVVSCLTFDIAAGSITALIGPNGAGKTTLIDLITGLQQPAAGDILFQGRSILGLGPSRIARRGIARSFQQARIIRAMTVTDNMRLGPGVTKARAEELLSELGLATRASDFAGELSVGQSRLLEVGRAAAMGARLIILDEPFAGIHAEGRMRLAGLIRRLRREAGTAFLVADHDLNLLAGLADDAIVLGPERSLTTDRWKGVTSIAASGGLASSPTSPG